MSDKRISLTPIIVGVVIALLGILTGLYVADNARQQLAVAQLPGGQAGEVPLVVEDPVTEETPAPSVASVELAGSMNDDADVAELPELPALAPVVVDEEPLTKPQPRKKVQSKPARRKPAAAARSRNAHAAKKRTVARRQQARGEVDDFVELSAEEVNRMLTLEKGGAAN